MEGKKKHIYILSYNIIYLQNRTLPTSLFSAEINPKAGVFIFVAVNDRTKKPIAWIAEIPSEVDPQRWGKHLVSDPRDTRKIDWSWCGEWDEFRWWSRVLFLFWTCKASDFIVCMYNLYYINILYQEYCICDCMLCTSAAVYYILQCN